VLLRSKTVLDVFMNFLAIGFITEVDNTLMELKAVKLRASLVDFKFLVEHREEADHSLDIPQDEVPKMPVTMTLLVISNMLTLFSCVFSQASHTIARAGHDQAEQIDWFQCWVVLLVALGLCDAALWISSRYLGAWRATLWCHLVTISCFWINVFYRYLNNGTFLFMWNPLLDLLSLSMVFFWIPVATAAEVDCLALLQCPTRLPLLFWTSCVSGPIFMHQLLLYG